MVVAFGFGWVSSTILYIHINLRGAGLGEYTRAPRSRVFRRWISALFGARVGFDPILPCLSKRVCSSFGTDTGVFSTFLLS